ncbi:MAG: hypothetical protein PHQ03_07045 [Methylococcales bacterium]|nr:hypothetical protein [Methylococcales bacterium]
MFNFKSLKLTKRCDSESTSSFVGIRRNENGEVEFRLPHGFDDFPENNFDVTKNLFFKMYRTFKKFERDNWRPNILDTRSAGKDQVQKEKDGYRFKNKEDNEVVLYSKIALIENLLDVYRDLALDQMERRIGADEKVDYSKIDRYLDRAIYLDKHVIYIDEMDLPRQTLRYESTTLIDLFCFIVTELQNELEQDIEPRVQELAHRFSEQHLSHEESLFNEETFETTIRTLKGVLDDIDKRTAYKDEDYWRLFEAIELFLYGELDMDNPHENGVFWGIKNFSSVWEDMCTSYSFATFSKIIYADTNIVLNGKRVANATSAGYFPIYKKEDFDDPFFIEFRGKRRWLRPDLVYDVIESSNEFDECDWIFDEIIQIIPKSNNRGIRIDFDVRLIDKTKSKIYKAFCLNLKKSDINGVRCIGENSFKSYPKSELEKQKKFIQNVHKNKINQMELERKIRFLDWKYMDLKCFIHANKKLETDITKQLCYEFTLRNLKSNETKIESQFVIPWFYNETAKDIGDVVDSKILYSRLRENKIEVFKANFSKIQQIYLTHD